MSRQIGKLAKRHRARDRVRVDPLLHLPTEEIEVPSHRISPVSPIPKTSRNLARAKNQAAQNLRARLLRGKTVMHAEEEISERVL